MGPPKTEGLRAPMERARKRRSVKTAMLKLRVFESTPRVKPYPNLMRPRLA